MSTEPQTNIGLAVAWTWQYDRPFVDAILRSCRARDISTMLLDRSTIASATDAVLRGDLHFSAFFDRASDEDEVFHPLSHFLLKESRQGVDPWFINPIDTARRAADKATMHLEFITHGIHVPNTIILSPYGTHPAEDIPASRLEALGSPFVIKPANTTGGGIGVTVDARTIEDVKSRRLDHPNDKYLLQQRVAPVYLSESRAWFRVFFAFGDTRLCWWDDQTHIYEEVTPDEERWFGLGLLREHIQTIAGVCGLDFFSSEFVQLADGQFVSVDYVNELCDMRPKSTTPNGVPDELITWVAERMAERVSTRTVAGGAATRG